MIGGYVRSRDQVDDSVVALVLHFEFVDLELGKDVFPGLRRRSSNGVEACRDALSAFGTSFEQYAEASITPRSHKTSVFLSVNS